MRDTITVQAFAGHELEEYLPDLAQLRIEVFREFPYLYDGDMAYEARYLHRYVQGKGSVIVIAFDGETVIGASTAMPLVHEMDSIRQPFVAQDYSVADVFYLSESVLRRTYRGQGIGVRFFEAREAHARQLGGFKFAAFCAVKRPADHPRRPPDYVPLDAFWQRRGYQEHPELRTSLSWRDLDEAVATPKPMVFWLKDLS